MAELGWCPKDIEKIDKAVVMENMREAQTRMQQRTHSLDTLNTRVGSVFDDESAIDDSDDEDGDEYDYLYCFEDGRPDRRKADSDEELTLDQALGSQWAGFGLGKTDTDQGVSAYGEMA